MRALINHGKVYCGINKTFKIFENLECSALGFEMVFEEFIDTFCVACDGSLLFVCLRNGGVYCFYSSEQTRMIFLKYVHTKLH